MFHDALNDRRDIPTRNFSWRLTWAWL